MSVSVRIAGRHGKTTVELAKGSTFAQVLAEAAESLGLPGFDASGNTVTVDAKQVEDLDQAVPEDAKKVDVAPRAALG